MGKNNLRGKKIILVLCDTLPKCILGPTRTKFSSQLTEYEIKNLGTPDSPLQNKKFPDQQWPNVANLQNSNLERNVAPARRFVFI